MVTLTLQDEQVLELVRQLPDERRSWLFQQLVRDEWPTWADLSAYGAIRAERVAAQRGLAWESMSDSEREVFVDDLLHETD